MKSLFVNGIFWSPAWVNNVGYLAMLGLVILLGMAACVHKGQLISEWLFDVLNFPKKILPLALKIGWSTNIKALYLYVK